jgi:hypothetical protein
MNLHFLYGYFFQIYYLKTDLISITDSHITKNTSSIAGVFCYVFQTYYLSFVKGIFWLSLIIISKPD